MVGKILTILVVGALTVVVGALLMFLIELLLICLLGKGFGFSMFFLVATLGWGSVVVPLAIIIAAIIGLRKYFHNRMEEWKKLPGKGLKLGKPVPTIFIAAFYGALIFMGISGVGICVLARWASNSF